jgi:nucleotide-binding universal stress UspA family protein
VYSKIIVGYDGTRRGEDAFALGALLAKETGISLLVAHVTGEQPKWTNIDRDYQRSLRGRLGDVFGRVKEAAAAQGVRYETASFSSVAPARGLRDLAKSVENALLVLGSTHRGSLGRVFIGSVGQQLLEDAPCAVAVAPRGFEKAADRQLSSLGVGFDGSPEANVALRHADALAGTLDASLRAIAAVKRRESAGADLGETVRELSQRPGTALQPELELVRGDPASALSKAAADLDLLITGSRGHGPMRHAVVGSVAAKLMRTSPSPVLVVPRGAGGPADEPAQSASSEAE